MIEPEERLMLEELLSLCLIPASDKRLSLWRGVWYVSVVREERLVSPRPFPNDLVRPSDDLLSGRRNGRYCMIEPEE